MTKNGQKKKNVNPKLEQIRLLQLLEKKQNKTKQTTFQETIPRNLS